MKILAIDPGSTQSAYVVYDTDKRIIFAKDLIENNAALADLPGLAYGADQVVIEYPAPRGQPLYTQLVDAIFWIGRFYQAMGLDQDDGLSIMMDRKDVKMAMCGRTTANDAAVNAAVRSRFSKHENIGGGKVPEVGIKNNPGPLFGVKKDIWAALAVALTYEEMRKTSPAALDNFLY